MSFITLNVTFTAALIALIVTPLVGGLARRFDFVDFPGRAPHKLHTRPIPIAGGWVILVALLAVGMAFGSLALPEIQRLVLPALIVFFFGVLDDVYILRPHWKFLGQLVASLLLVFMGTQVLLFSNQLLNLLITLLWMIGITNAYNFVDSTDGLAAGLGSLAAAFFMIVTFDANQVYLSVFSAILLGACIGVYYFNALPARIFLGDSGAQFLGFLLAAIAIDYTPVGFERIASWYVPILLMAVPIFDTVLIVVSRIRRGRQVFKGAHDHTYHRLVALGINPNRAVLSMQMIALLLGNLGFIALVMNPLWANLIFGLVLLIAAAAINYLDDRIRWN